MIGETGRELLTTGLIGVLSGFLVSIPVGPINVTIINEGARRGFFWALMIGMGAVLMEVIYCSMAFAGFATIFHSKLLKAAMELISFLLMLIIGFKYLVAARIKTHFKSADVIEEKLHPHSAFLTGFIRVLGNPAVLLFWLALAAAYTSHEWVEPTLLSKSVMIIGVGIGAAFWFILLSWGVSLGHQKLSENTLLWMSHISGAVMVLIALGIGIRIILLLAMPHRT